MGASYKRVKNSFGSCRNAKWNKTGNQVTRGDIYANDDLILLSAMQHIHALDDAKLAAMLWLEMDKV